MLNELEEFAAYTQPVHYTAKNKYDSSFLGRFTWDMLLDFLGFSRVLTVVARGYLFRDGEADLDRARSALCAWCSIPERKKASPKEDWQYGTDFRALHDDFPELVDQTGHGWLVRHVHGIVRFTESNSDMVSRTAIKNAVLLKNGFDSAWRKKVIQMQMPLFSSSTEGAWTLRFDDILADALEAGPLQNKDFKLSTEVSRQLAALTPDGIPENVLPMLLKYYIANKQPDSDWVVLPVTNFDAYFGTSSFSKVWLGKLPETVIERSSGFGCCRCLVFVKALEKRITITVALRSSCGGAFQDSEM